MGIFDGIFNTGPQNDARDAQVNGLTQGYNNASSAINTGQTNTNTDYAAALAPYTTNLGVTQAGQNNYADATGVNGAAGYAKALDSFHTNPGYDWVQQQGDQNILRNQSASGQLASGGTNIDLLKYGQGLANQNWNQYITNLQPFIGASTANAGGAAAVGTAKAGTDAGFAGKLADLGWQKETGIGNANANAELAHTTTNANAVNFGMQAAKSLAGFLPI